jgi:hypothetical protein
LHVPRERLLVVVQRINNEIAGPDAAPDVVENAAWKHPLVVAVLPAAQLPPEELWFELLTHGAEPFEAGAALTAALDLARDLQAGKTEDCVAAQPPGFSSAMARSTKSAGSTR